MGVMERRRAIIAAQDQFVPPEYQKYDYLETPYNAEGYAYIDTGVAGNNNNLKFVFDYLTVERRSYGRIIGNWDTEDKACWRLIQASGTSDSRGYIFTANNRKAGSSTSISATPYGTTTVNYTAHIELEYKKCTTVVTTVTAVDDGSAVSSRSLAIGARYPGDTTNGCAKGRFYHYFRIYDNGKLIRNYIPVKRKSDNKAGFYDTVNHAFKPSEGTQDFTAGNDT